MKAFETLKKNWEFQETFKKGRSYYNSSLVLYVSPLPETKGQLKVAFCAGKKLGSAVKRNRIKRQMRHAFLNVQKRMKSGFSLIIIARGKAEELDFSQLSAALQDLLAKANLLRKANHG